MNTTKTITLITLISIIEEAWCLVSLSSSDVDHRVVAALELAHKYLNGSMDDHRDMEIAIDWARTGMIHSMHCNASVQSYKAVRRVYKSTKPTNMTEILPSGRVIRYVRKPKL